MKILCYRQSKNKNLILIHIGDPATDPLETNKKVYAFLQGQPEYKQYLKKLDDYNKFIEANRGDSAASVKERALTKLKDIRTMKAGLQEKEAAFRGTDSVWMIPADSVMVSDEVAASVALDFDPDFSRVVIITLDPDGAYTGHSTMASNAGKVYRLKNTVEWITADPDEDIPSDAMFTDPDLDEKAEIERLRVQGLSREAKDIEREKFRARIKNAYGLELSVANAEDDPEVRALAISKAKDQYNTLIAQIEAKYS